MVDCLLEALGTILYLLARCRSLILLDQLGHVRVAARQAFDINVE